MESYIESLATQLENYIQQAQVFEELLIEKYHQFAEQKEQIKSKTEEIAKLKNQNTANDLSQTEIFELKVRIRKLQLHVEGQNKQIEQLAYELSGKKEEDIAEIQQDARQELGNSQKAQLIQEINLLKAKLIKEEEYSFAQNYNFLLLKLQYEQEQKILQKQSNEISRLERMVKSYESLFYTKKRLNEHQQNVVKFLELREKKNCANIENLNTSLKSENEKLINTNENLKKEIYQLQDQLNHQNKIIQETNLLKQRIIEEIQTLQPNLLHQVIYEDKELKQEFFKQMQNYMNNLSNKDQEQESFLQLMREYQDYKAWAEDIIYDLDQQLNQAKSTIKELEPYKESAKLGEENNRQLVGQLNQQQQKNHHYQQKIKELEAQICDLRNPSQDVVYLQFKLKSFQEEHEELKTQNYEQEERIKNYEIQLDLLRQVEIESPKKISKLFQEKSEIQVEFDQFKVTTQREIYKLKQEKQMHQNEIENLKQKSEIQAKFDQFKETTHKEIYTLKQEKQMQQIEIENLKQKVEIQTEFDQYKETTQREIYKLKQEKQMHQSETENLKQNIQIQEKANFQFQNELTQFKQQLFFYIQNEKTYQSKMKDLTDYFQAIQDQQQNFEEKMKIEILEIDKTIKQFEFLLSLIQEQFVINQVSKNQQEIIQVEFHEKLVQTEQIENVLFEIGRTENIEKINNADMIQPEQEQPRDQQKSVLFQQSSATLQECIQTNSKGVEQNDNQIIQNHCETQQRNKSTQPKGSLESNYDGELDSSIIKSLKEKIEFLNCLRNSQEKELTQLKENNKKQEKKIQQIQNLGVPRRKQLNASEEKKKQQENELIIQQQRQINELQEKLKNSKFEYPQQILQSEINYYKENLLKQQEQTKKYKEQLDKIYSLGPDALNQLQSQPELQSQQSQQSETYHINTFLYIKSQGIHQWQFLEIIKQQQLRFYYNVNGKIEKSIFDQYIFDEIFLDAQKIIQYFNSQNSQLINDTCNVFLVLGQQKMHKKLVMVILIEWIINLIQNKQQNQMISICYQEKINNQWIEIEQFNIQISKKDLDSTICNIKTYLKTKQNSTGEKIRKLSIEYQPGGQIAQTQQFIIATSSSIPSGDFKEIIQKLFNVKISQNMKFNIFFNISPQLKHHQKTKEILQMAKIRELIGMVDFSQSKSASQYNTIVNESQIQIRIANNKLILKNQEVDQMKKLLLNQLVQLQKKYDLQIAYQNDTQTLISYIIQKINEQVIVKINQRQNKQSKTIDFLNKLVMQLDQILKGQSVSIQNSDSNDKIVKNRASEIPLY